jgi:hypothetical protein
MMNQQLLDVILGLVRHGLTTLGGGLVTAGYLTSDQSTQAVTMVVGFVSIVAGAVWSWWQKKQAAAKLVAVATSSAATGTPSIPKGAV